MKNQNLAPNTNSLSQAIHKNSQSITKKKPKTRIIHLPVPEVIEIEAADFQKFVQILTGKKSTETKTKLKEPECPSLCNGSVNAEAKILDVQCGSRTEGEEIASYADLVDGSQTEFEDWDEFINELIDFTMFLP